MRRVRNASGITGRIDPRQVNTEIAEQDAIARRGSVIDWRRWSEYDVPPQDVIREGIRRATGGTPPDLKTTNALFFTSYDYLTGLRRRFMMQAPGAVSFKTIDDAKERIRRQFVAQPEDSDAGRILRWVHADHLAYIAHEAADAYQDAFSVASVFRATTGAFREALNPVPRDEQPKKRNGLLIVGALAVVGGVAAVALSRGR